MPAAIRGFTILEVAVAMVIFSVGLLGLAGLQLAGTQSNHDALMRSLAVQQAYDMADRMRSNTEGFRDSAAYESLAGIPGSMPACTATSCTANQVATRDLFEWNTANDALLPTGQGQVQGDGSGQRFTITVHWDANRSGAAGLNCPPQSDADLECVRLIFRP
ncbi:MAG: type IV pilus modification protein PilV [Pseudomonadota bacterium]|nr:MAG: type IV pilus modification protein PilV [Pseudomonadota bacterium]